MNRKRTKISIAVIITIAVALWVIITVRPHHYEGTDLDFAIGEGSVEITNPSEAIPVRLVDSSSHAFKVFSESEDISGTSTRESNDGKTVQVFDFELPSGTTEFTVKGNGNISFISNSATNLEATANPLTVAASRVRMAVLAVVVFVMAFYISRLYGHLWISEVRRQNARDYSAAQETEQENFDRIMERRASKRTR